MALLEVALGGKKKLKKNEPPWDYLLINEEHSPVGLETVLDSLPPCPACGMQPGHQ